MVTAKENTYKIKCRTKGTLSNWNMKISASDKDTAFFRAKHKLEEKGIAHQTVIETIRKVSTK